VLRGENNLFSRNLDKAKEAFKNKDIDSAKKAHEMKKRSYEKHNTEQGQYIKNVVYGGLDGIITTFAVVAGVAGAALSPGVVLIMGFANLIADGLSMAIGDYSFVIFGFIPVLAYVLSRFVPYFAENTFIIASVLTGATLFTLGALKVKVTEENWIKSGLEMLIVGGLTATAAYIIGNVLAQVA